MAEIQTTTLKTFEEFQHDWESQHPIPARPAIQNFVEPKFKAPLLEKTARYWTAIFSIGGLIFVSMLRTQGAFYDLARHGTFIPLLNVEIANIESMIGALALDVGLVMLMMERVNRTRYVFPLGAIWIGLIAVLGITAATNFQQGMASFARERGNNVDIWQLGIYGIYLAILSGGIPVVLAIIADAFGQMRNNFDEMFKRLDREHAVRVEKLRAEHDERARLILVDHEADVSKWRNTLNAKWGGYVRRNDPNREAHVRSGPAIQTQQTFVRRRAERTTRANANGEITNEQIITAFTELGGQSLRTVAAHLTERTGKTINFNALARRADKLIGSGLRKSEEGRYFASVQHPAPATTTGNPE